MNKYINPPFSYTGNKHKLLPQLIPEMDYTKDYFIDLFCGGGSIYTNVVDKYSKILINDIIQDLIGIHKELINNPNKIIDEVKLLASCKTDEEKYYELRDSYNKEKSPEKLWALMLSCNSNLMRFNNKMYFIILLILSQKSLEIL